MFARHALVFLFVLPLASSSASALGGTDGSDDCATPTLLGSAPGTFAWNCGATTGTQGQSEAACLFAGTTGIQHDAWFSWTAPTSGAWRVTMPCGTSSLDPKMALYAGQGCPTAPAIACSDDACGNQPEILFQATVGAAYTLQVGVRPGSFNGGGAFVIAPITTSCGTAGGPDLVVSSILESTDYTGSGGLDAFMLGFRVENFGSTPLAWNPATNEHPVFAQNLYWYHTDFGAARFEQIGQSWALHPLSSAGTSWACTCLPPGSSTLLGTGCADVTRATSAGDQTRLGPRFEVDALTGAFAWPPSNPPYTGEMARRVEVSLDELPPFGGAFIVSEILAVAADDAAAGHAANNASWVPIQRTGLTLSDCMFRMTDDATHVGESALHAWQGYDPQVRLTEVAIPGEGRLIVASRASSIGSGLTHYEYAVSNVDSTRGVGSFAVPIPAGVQLIDVGFHSVLYRDGDGPAGTNISSTPWSWTIAGGQITWTTETLAQNAAANSIRWGTTCNFRFDVAASSGVGTADLGLWRPGTPTAVSCLVDVPVTPESSFGFCWSNDPATPCPCGNHETSTIAMRGCTHSLGYGAELYTNGIASVSADTLVLRCGQLPYTTSVMFFQGTAIENGGWGSPFGDGVRCVTGSVVRIGSRQAAVGAASYPSQPSDPRVSVRGGVVAGDVRMYQAWYRNNASFCTSAAFNTTNGYRLLWAP
jgi:hypothetical protein